MSDVNGPTGNPYGEQPHPTGPPPPPPNPYDTGSQPTPPPVQPTQPPQPFGQAAPAPTDPYGQPAYGQPAYGQPAYGQPTYGQPAQPYGGYGQPAYQPRRDPSKRPGTVTAAAVITLVSAGLSLIGFVIGIFGLAVARQDFLDAIRDDQSFQDSGFSADSAYGLVMAVVIGFALWCLISCVLAIFVLRRSNIARILLVVSAAVSLLVSLVSITSIVSGVTLLAAVATIVLLFVGGANEWFRKEPPTQQIPGMTQY
jgi:hypothetical protein